MTHQLNIWNVTLGLSGLYHRSNCGRLLSQRNGKKLVFFAAFNLSFGSESFFPDATLSLQEERLKPSMIKFLLNLKPGMQPVLFFNIFLSVRHSWKTHSILLLVWKKTKCIFKPACFCQHTHVTNDSMERVSLPSKDLRVGAESTFSLI